jgi:prepilin-type N-terminal cleavage/methylation domain-containing protein
MKSPAILLKRTNRALGFTLLELIVVIAVIGVISSIVGSIFSSLARNDAAQSVASDMLVVGQGGDEYIQKRGDDIQLSTPIALPSGGFVANPLRPTLAELRDLGYLTVGVSNPYTFESNTANFAVLVSLSPVGCTPPTCTVNQITILSSPWKKVEAAGQPVNEEMLNLVVGKMQGKGMLSSVDVPGVLVSKDANFTIPNPYTAAGHLAYFSGANGGLNPAYLRPNDTRDPKFRGGTTVSGMIPGTSLTLQINGAANIANSLAVGGTSSFAGASTFGGTATFNAPVVLNGGIDSDIIMKDPGTGVVCVRILRVGQIDINCNGILNAKAGTFTGPNGTVKVGTTGTAYALDTTGKIRGDQGFYSAVGSMFGDNTLGVRASGAVFTVQTSSAVDALAVHDTGRVGARNSLATPMLGLSDPIAAGAACASATDVPATNVTNAASTSLRALVGGGFAMCSGGVWTPMFRVAAAGGACSPEGSFAATSTGVQMICSGGTYVPLADRFGKLVFAESFVVTEGTLVPKPVCSSGSTGQQISIIAGNETQKIQYVNRGTIDNGGSWKVVLQDGSGVAIGGVDALAQTYCNY